MGRRGPGAKTETVLRPVRQWEEHGKEGSWSEDRNSFETSEAVGGTWQHAEIRILNFIKIRITLLLRPVKRWRWESLHRSLLGRMGPQRGQKGPWRTLSRSTQMSDVTTPRPGFHHHH